MLLPRTAQPKRAGPPLCPLELLLAAMTAPRAARPRRARARARARGAVRGERAAARASGGRARAGPGPARV